MSAQHQLSLLAQALGRVLVASGIVRDDGGFSGPQLLMFAEDLERQLRQGRLRAAWAPAFDALSLHQEELVLQFCQEIAGPLGQPGQPPDPVRLLEMAHQLYEAERDDAIASTISTDGPWKLSREYLPYHPSASHIEPAYRDGWNAAYYAGQKVVKPIDMVLHCPVCHTQHIDGPGMHSEFDDHTWTNPPHRSHLCHECGHIWRPADVATNGVQAVKTRGKHDMDLSDSRSTYNASQNDE